MSNPGKRLLETERFVVETVERRGPQGAVSERAVVRHPGAVTIVPITAEGKLCLIRNYRVAVAETLVELPAGTLEPNELPAQTAARELIEETGFQAAQLTFLQTFFMSPGILDERMHLFLAEQLSYVGPAREESEEIENLIVGWEEALQLVRGGKVQDAKTLAGLFVYHQLRLAG